MDRPSDQIVVPVLECVVHVHAEHPAVFFFSSSRRHTRCALVTGVQTCALPIYCPNAARLLSNYGYRVVKAKWTGNQEIAFLTGLKKIGRASCRERVCRYVSVSVVAVALTTKSPTC